MGHDVERPVDVAAQHLRQGLAELLEGRGELGVVGVGVLGHQSCAEEDGHRLALGQAEGREQRSLGQPPPAALGPDRDPQLLVERLQVAIGVPAGHAEEPGELIGRDPVRVRREVGRDPVEARHPVALAAGEGVAPGQVPAIHAPSEPSVRRAGTRSPGRPGGWPSGSPRARPGWRPARSRTPVRRGDLRRGRADRRQRPRCRWRPASPRGRWPRPASGPGGRRRGRSCRPRRRGSGGPGRPRRRRGRDPPPARAAPGRRPPRGARGRATRPPTVAGGTGAQRVPVCRVHARFQRATAPWRPTSRVVVTSASQRKLSPVRAPRTRAIPSERPSTVPPRSSVRLAEAPAASAPSHRGGRRAGSVGP